MKKMEYGFSVPEAKRVRMLISTDAKNEADDQYAIAHHLMTPKFDVKGIIPGHFDKCHAHGNTDMVSAAKVGRMLRFFGGTALLPVGVEDIPPEEFSRLMQEAGLADRFPLYTAQQSLEEVNLVLKLMDLEGVCPVAKGAEGPIPDEQTPVCSDGARLIVEEAMKDDPRPLYVACQGSLTDLASAILMEPRICNRATCIWIGGGAYPEGENEFNLSQDIKAANVVFSSAMPVWQVPKNVYKQMAVSLAELQWKVAPCGKIGKYLFEQMVAFNNKLAFVPHWPHGEIWGLGDSPTVGLLMFESEREDVYDVIPAPRFDEQTMKYIHGQNYRTIRVYKDANARMTLEDFFCKLAINYGN